MTKNIKVDFDIPERHIKKRLPPQGIFGESFNYLEGCFRESLGFFLYRQKLVRKRSQVLVGDSYERIWGSTNEEWAHQMTRANSHLIYRGEHWIANGWLLKNIFVQMLDGVFKQLGSRNVLEVGSGRGNNVISLSSKNPGLRLTGLEFTQSGLRRGKELLDQYSGFITNIIDSPEYTIGAGDGRVGFVKGSALEMPLADGSFDTAFTVLALEQMPYDYPRVLKELRRVVSRYAVFIEPFSEANNLRGWLHLKKFDYFRFSYSRFNDFGFKPIIFFTDYPQKANQGSGLLVTEVIH